MKKPNHPPTEAVVGCYGLDVGAKKAISCMQDIEDLCWRVRESFPGGCEDADKWLVEAHSTIWENVMRVYKSEYGQKIKGTPPKRKAITVTPAQSNPFDSW